MLPIPLLRALAVASLLPLAALAQDQVVYDDARQGGWKSWSWAPVKFDTDASVHTGLSAIQVSPAAEEQALYLHHSPFDSSGCENLTFWINGGATGGQSLQVRATLGGKPQAPMLLPALAADAWQRVSIPLADLGAANQPNFDGFWIQNPKGAPLTAYSVDDIALEAIPVPDLVQIRVDAGKVIGVLDGRIYGINTAIWDSHLGSAATVDILRSMGTQALRFPGGSASDDYDWQYNRSISKPHGWASSTATFAKLAETTGAQVYMTANYGSGTPEQAAAWVAYCNASPDSTTPIGIDSKGGDWQTAGYWAAFRAASPLPMDDSHNFLRAAHPAPFGFRYWEIGNENYGGWEEDQHGVEGSGLSGARHDPATYARYFKEFRDKMLAVDPTIKIGAVVIAREDAPVTNGTPVANTNGGADSPNQPNRRRPRNWTVELLAALKSLQVQPHFYIYHVYPQNQGDESDAFLLQSGASFPVKADELRTAIRDGLGLAPEEKIELAMTELNSVSSEPGKQSTSLVNGLFYADAAGWLARAKFDACLWWDLRNGPPPKSNHSELLYGWRYYGDYGVAAQRPPGANRPALFPTFYAGKLLAHWGRGADQALEAESDYPLLSAHAVRLAGGGLALLVINKHPTRDLKAEIALGGFAPSSETAKVYEYGKSNDRDGSDLTEREIDHVSGTFGHIFPAYSMSVVRLH